MTIWELLGIHLMIEYDEELGDLPEERYEAFERNEWFPFTMYLEASILYRGAGRASGVELAELADFQMFLSTPESAVPSDLPRNQFIEKVEEAYIELEPLLCSLGISPETIGASFTEMLESDSFVRKHFRKE